ncbi:hypothetical protein AB1Y20_013068 [Prymnesium parvum]|uniref:Uncharacterized protein n=1 Tax=Prymnesium parvum TaxID=97485 RepID=A0AB34IN89_PRYPA
MRFSMGWLRWMPQPHVLNPLLYLYTKVAPHMLSFLYRKVGISGILMMPWLTLAFEKTTYDTFCAARGYDMYAESDVNPTPHGGFPSGGAQLPSLSLITVRGEQDRIIIPFLGDKPRSSERNAHDSR